MNPTEKSLKTLVKGAGFIFIGMIISKFLTYLYRIIIARISPTDYGLFSLSLAFSGFIIFFSRFGLHFGLIKFISYYRIKKQYTELKNVLFSVLIFEIIISTFLAILGFIFAEKIAIQIFHNSNLVPLFKILILTIPFSALTLMFTSTTNAFEKAKYDMISRNFVETTIKLLGTILLIYLGFGIIGVAYAYVLAIFVTFLVAGLFLKKTIKKYIPPSQPKWQFKEILKYSWPLLLSGFMIYLHQWTDTFMLGYFKDIITVGIYNVALPTANLLYLFPFGLMTLFIPVMTKLSIKNDKKSLKSVYISTTKWIILFNSLILFLLLFFGKELITLLFGPSYAQGYPALIILSIGYYFSFLVLNSQNLLLIHKKTKFIFFNNLVSAIINVTLNLILIPKYGLLGAAIATCTSYLFNSLLISLKTYSLTKIYPFKIKFIFIPLFASLSVAIGLLIKQLFIINIFYLLSLFVLISLIYLLSLIFTKVLDKNDYIIIKAIKNKILSKT